MEVPRLTSGAVEEIAELPNGSGMIQPVLQVAYVWPVNVEGAAGAQQSEWFRMLVSDGVHPLQSMLSIDLNHLITDDTLRSEIQGRRCVRQKDWIFVCLL
jgi:hypothetical protein